MHFDWRTTLDSLVWVLGGFISGCIPWAMLIGWLFTGKDIRHVGDANPGTANAWKSGGWFPGSISMILETGKGFIPVGLATSQMATPAGFADHFELSLVALAPIVGHAWSPFLKFKGGKALATSWGSWIGITGGLAIPVALILLGLFHTLQRNHAVTVTLTLALFLAIFLPIYQQLYIVIFWGGNLGLVIHKHWPEYSAGVIPRSWLRNRIKDKS